MTIADMKWSGRVLTSAVCPAVPAIFQALCDGAAANPDEDIEDDEGDFFFDQVRQQSILVTCSVWLPVNIGIAAAATGCLSASMLLCVPPFQ